MRKNFDHADYSLHRLQPIRDLPIALPCFHSGITDFSFLKAPL